MSDLWVTGTGGVGPAGLGLGRGRDDTPPQPDGGPRQVRGDLPLKEGLPPAAVRWLDKASLWWVNAARQALAGGRDPGVEVSQVVGLEWGPTLPVMDLLDKVRSEGYSAMNPATFPFSVGNAPAGQAGILLGLKGAAVTLCAKECSGLAAIVEACRLVNGGQAAECVAGGVDQLDPLLLKIITPLRRPGSLPAGEGAYAVRLVSANAPPAGALARVAGWASCGARVPAHRFPPPLPLLERLERRLADRTGWSRDGVDWLALPGDTPQLRQARVAFGRRWTGAASPVPFQENFGACGASWAAAAGTACLAIASGEARRAVLMALATGGAAFALAMEAPGAQ